MCTEWGTCISWYITSYLLRDWRTLIPLSATCMSPVWGITCMLQAADREDCGSGRKLETFKPDIPHMPDIPGMMQQRAGTVLQYMNHTT